MPLHRSTVAALIGLAASAPANAQTPLPTITVTTPSPVSIPKAAPASPQGPAPSSKRAATVPAALAPVPDILAGTLLVVDDTFLPVTVATSAELAASPGKTLADALQSKPGITGTTFAPGANRPVIRGLDTYRVRTQENGVGTHDVAAISEDHAVPLDPFAADTVEVIRGPGILRFGSQAIGGVVSANNDRIPEAVPRNGVSGEVRGGWNSGDRGGDGAFQVTAGAGGVVVHADAFARDHGDYRTPLGRQLNSYVRSDGVALGSSLVGPSGFLGIAFTRFESTYGIPGGEAAADAKFIDLTQDRFLSKGEWRVRDHGIEAIRYWFGSTRYLHNEIEGPSGDVGSTFRNRENEGRIEIQHLAFSTLLGELRGAAGIQIGRRNLSAESFEGDSLLDPTRTRSIAAFLFEELQMTQTLRLQGAIRIEDARVAGRGLSDFSDPSALEIFEGERRFKPVSASAGLLYTLPMGVVARLTGQYVERAPDAGELYSKGLHEATGTFEIGNPRLGKERAATLEFGLKKTQGALRFDASAFYTRFDGFIFKRLTGVTCEATIDTCTGLPGEFELNQLVFEQRDAVLRGVELAAQYDVAPVWRGVWGVEGQYDFVRATFAAGENVPRIPPHRVGAGIYYRDVNWFARVFALHALDQNRIAENETRTDGYTMLNAELSYTFKLAGSGKFEPSMTIGIRGENLFDDEVRNHVSFKKDDVLQPGRTVRVFGGIKF